MNVELEIQLHEQYLYARATGQRTTGNIASVARQVVAACVKHALNAALVDVRELEGRISIFDAFMIPARLFPSLDTLTVLKRVAVLDTKERSERIAFFERLSQKGGYNLRAFTELELAMEWLTNEAEAESKA